ncbi:MAG: rRNA maturation RNase YbeY [Bacillota bacterium]
MNLEIDFLDETDQLDESDRELVQGLLNYAASQENVEPASELTLSFVTNERIKEINKDYRDKDQETDVISFAMEELGEDETKIVGDGIPRILGDIIISVEKAKDQAEEYGHSFSRELGFLALHGFLHLLGYDHMSEADEKHMFGRQKEILDGYGLQR